MHGQLDSRGNGAGHTNYMDKPVRVGLIGNASRLTPQQEALLPSMFAEIERMLNDKMLIAKVNRDYYRGTASDMKGFDWFME